MPCALICADPKSGPAVNGQTCFAKSVARLRYAVVYSEGPSERHCQGHLLPRSPSSLVVTHLHAHIERESPNTQHNVVDLQACRVRDGGLSLIPSCQSTYRARFVFFTWDSFVASMVYRSPCLPHTVFPYTIIVFFLILRANTKRIPSHLTHHSTHLKQHIPLA